MSGILENFRLFGNRSTLSYSVFLKIYDVDLVFYVDVDRRICDFDTGCLGQNVLQLLQIL